MKSALSVPDLRKEYQLSNDLAVIVSRAVFQDKEGCDVLIEKLRGNSFYDGESERAIKYLEYLRR